MPNNLVNIWLVGLDTDNLPALRSYSPSDLVGLIGAAPAEHGHEVSHVAGLSEAIASLIERVTVLESQSTRVPSYSPAVNQFLQSADVLAMRDSLGMSGIEFGEFGAQWVASNTVGDALLQIQEYLEDPANG